MEKEQTQDIQKQMIDREKAQFPWKLARNATAIGLALVGMDKFTSWLKLGPTASIAVNEGMKFIIFAGIDWRIICKDTSNKEK